MSTSPLSSANRPYLNRRGFIRRSSAALVAASVPYSITQSQVLFESEIDRLSEADSGDLKVLAMAGLDAAKAAGANYADLVFRIIHKEDWGIFLDTWYPSSIEAFKVGVGIRALVNGLWGFAGLD